MDSEVIERIRAKYPDLDLRKYLKHQLMGLIGVKVKCSSCGYSWPYTGSAKRIKCNRCHHNIRVYRYPEPIRS
jgi:uncharacterized paraquat-inducible protein A